MLATNSESGVPWGGMLAAKVGLKVRLITGPRVVCCAIVGGWGMSQLGGVGGTDSADGDARSEEEPVGMGAGSGGAADIIATLDAKRSSSHADISSGVSFSNLVAPDCHPL